MSFRSRKIFVEQNGKGGSMKKGLLVFVVLFLAIPALSFAGSATSRWDLTIGGFVKADTAYTSTDNAGPPHGADEWTVGRENYAGSASVNNTSPNFSMASGQTSLNFLIKGPDTWGAKTSAFIQGNFLGQTTNSGQPGTRYGTFTMSHAFMDFTWANTKLTVGQTWQLWAFQPTFNTLGATDLLAYGKGTTVPQITLTQTVAKNWFFSLGIQDPTKSADQTGGTANNGQALAPAGVAQSIGLGSPYIRVDSVIPDTTGEIDFMSDACGKIGPNGLRFGIGGFAGQERVQYIDPGLVGNTTAKQSSGNSYTYNTLPRWAAAIHGFIPIIPEKNLNKQGALSLSGNGWIGQNVADYFLGGRGTYSMVPYDRASEVPGVTTVNSAGALSATPATVTHQYAVPTSWGYWAQATYYLTDKVYFNGIGSYLRNNWSNAYENSLGVNQVKQAWTYIANILYDVNPAVRVGVQYTYNRADWGNYGLSSSGWGGGSSDYLGTGTGTGANQYNGGLLSPYGSSSTYRIAFWYFF